MEKNYFRQFLTQSHSSKKKLITDNISGRDQFYVQFLFPLFLFLFSYFCFLFLSPSFRFPFTCFPFYNFLLKSKKNPEISNFSSISLS